MKWNTHNPRELGRVIDSLHAQMRDEQNKLMVIWEKKLRLHVKPRPRLMPQWFWKRLVGLLIEQSVQEEFFKGSQPMPPEVLDANAKNTQDS